MDLTSQLGDRLTELGYTPTQIGRALLPDGSKTAVYTTGARVLRGERATSLERIAVLCRALSLTIEIGPQTLRIERLP